MVQSPVDARRHVKKSCANSAFAPDADIYFIDVNFSAVEEVTE